MSQNAQKKGKKDTAVEILIAQNEILLHEIAGRGCWRTKHGSNECNDQDPKAAGGYEKWACPRCRAAGAL